MAWDDVVQILTLLAVVAALIQLRLHNHQMHRDFESLYIQRYWELMDNRSPKFELDAECLDTDRRVIYAYFQLCEDELDLRRVGRITDGTWAEWQRWIREQCGSPGYAEALAGAPSDRWPRLRRHLTAESDHDPIAHGRFWRFVHGL